jgi:hypothetical protein
VVFQKCGSPVEQNDTFQSRLVRVAHDQIWQSVLGVSSYSAATSVSKFCVLSQIFPPQFGSSVRTFRGSKSGSISAYPVANANERREESDLARCSAMVSVASMNKIPG